MADVELDELIAKGWEREATRLANRHGWHRYGSHPDRTVAFDFDGEDWDRPMWERPTRKVTDDEGAAATHHFPDGCVVPRENDHCYCFICLPACTSDELCHRHDPTMHDPDHDESYEFLEITEG